MTFLVCHNGKRINKFGNVGLFTSLDMLERTLSRWLTPHKATKIRCWAERSNKGDRLVGRWGALVNIEGGSVVFDEDLPEQGDPN